MLKKLDDASTVPPGGAFTVVYTPTSQVFAHQNPTQVYYQYRKYCSDNGFPVPSPEEVEDLMCQQHPLWCQGKVRGLGDLVYMVANPIAKAIDAVAGTNVQQCGGCKQRRESLNEKFPV